MVQRVSKFCQAHRIGNYEKNLKRMERAADARNVDFTYNIEPLVTQEMTGEEYNAAWGKKGYKWVPLTRIHTESLTEMQKAKDMLNAEMRSWTRLKRPNLKLKRSELPSELITILNSPEFNPYQSLPFIGVSNGFPLNPQEIRDGAKPIYEPTYHIRQGDVYKRRGHIVSIEYGDFTDSAWEVLAVLEPLTSIYFTRLEQPYLIHKMPHLNNNEGKGEEVHTLVPKEIDSNCDHCNTKRERKQLMLVRNKETGEIKRVGTSCLFEYTNIRPELIMKLYQTVETPTYGDPTIRHNLDQYDLFDFIVKAQRLFGYAGTYQKRRGWTLFYGIFLSPIDESANRSIEGIVLDESKSYLLPFDYGKDKASTYAMYSETQMKAEGLRSLPMSDEVSDVASEIISYCATLEGQSDFERNLRIIAQNGVVTKKNSGLAASMWFVWNRAVEEGKIESLFGTPPRESDEDSVPENLSFHLGEIGERIEFTGVLMRKSSRESQWGMTHLLVFQTIDDGNYPEGCEVVWWASTSKRLPDVGETIKVRGTVKKHGEFKGVQNTSIGRGHLTIIEESAE